MADPVIMTKVRAYGPELIEVESKVPEKGPTPKQKELASKLGFMEYYKENKEFTKFPKKADEWLTGILKEVIEMKCREDPSIILKYGCPEYRKFLRFYSLKTYLDPDWLRKRAEGSMPKKDESKDTSKAKGADGGPGEGEGAEGADGGPEGAVGSKGALTITITIPRAVLTASSKDPFQAMRDQFRSTHQRKLKELYDLLGYTPEIKGLVEKRNQFNSNFQLKLFKLKELLA
jgi:hypothetical protein